MVDAGVTLTVSAGVVVKVHAGAELAVLGRLVARGERSAPIILTSIHDDAIAGDTNGAAAATPAVPPAQGDWVGIGFQGDTTGSVLEHVEIRYAGYYGATGTNLEDKTRAADASSEGIDDLAEDPKRAARVQSACGTCHLFPPPDILPREMWPAQITRMADMKSKMPPDFEVAVLAFSKREISEWYQARTPEIFQLKAQLTRTAPGPIRFKRRAFGLGRGGSADVATVVRLGSRFETAPASTHPPSSRWPECA